MVHNPGGDWNPGQGDNPSYGHSKMDSLGYQVGG